MKDSGLFSSKYLEKNWALKPLDVATFEIAFVHFYSTSFALLRLTKYKNVAQIYFFQNISWLKVVCKFIFFTTKTHFYSLILYFPPLWSRFWYTQVQKSTALSRNKNNILLYFICKKLVWLFNENQTNRSEFWNFHLSWIIMHFIVFRLFCF